jgi:hypothetical protein
MRKGKSREILQGCGIGIGICNYVGKKILQGRITRIYEVLSHKRVQPEHNTFFTLSFILSSRS